MRKTVRPVPSSRSKASHIATASSLPQRAPRRKNVQGLFERLLALHHGRAGGRAQRLDQRRADLGRRGEGRAGDRQHQRSLGTRRGGSRGRQCGPVHMRVTKRGHSKRGGNTLQSFQCVREFATRKYLRRGAESERVGRHRRLAQDARAHQTNHVAEHSLQITGSKEEIEKIEMWTHCAPQFFRR